MEGLLSLKDTMAYLKVNKTTIEKMVRERKLTAYKIGGKYLRFKKDEVLLLKHERDAKKEEAVFFLHPTVQNVVTFNGFYIVSTLLLSAMLVYFLVI